MDSFFGVAWDDVTLDSVSGFLADAESEGLTWEAKGGERPHPGAIRKATSAFGNSQEGGFLILGVTRDAATGDWQLDPLDFGSDEATTWVSRVIRSGVTPVPFYDVREWRVDGGHVGLVRIDPVAEPPCMTTNGQVFTRVSGESVPVTDPETLRRLYARGEEQVARAMRKARNAAEPEKDFQISASVPRMTGYGLVMDSDPSELRLRIAVAPVLAEDEARALVLRRSFADEALDVARALPAEPLFVDTGHPQYAVETRRFGVTIRDAAETPQRWLIDVDSDASVLVALTAQPSAGDRAVLLAESVVQEAIRQAIAAATTLAKAAGGHGRGFLVVSAVGRDFQLRGPDNRDGDIPEIPHYLVGVSAHGPHEYRDGFEAWMEEGAEPSPELLAAIERDLLRACGITAWEPEAAHDHQTEADGQ